MAEYIMDGLEYEPSRTLIMLFTEMEIADLRLSMNKASDPEPIHTDLIKNCSRSLLPAFCGLLLKY